MSPGMRKRDSRLSEREEGVAALIVDASIAVHRGLGPGLVEKIYETCFCHELHKRGLSFQRQVTVPLIYDGIRFEEGLRLDVLVEDIIICELKAVEVLLPLFHAQLRSQLRLTQKRIGFLLNFNVPLMKEGINRLII